MICFQIARIVESRNPDYPKGKLVMGSMGWTTYSVVDPSLTQELGGATVHLVESLPRQLENTTLTKSSALGMFGVPGLTAYIGLMEIGKPKVRTERTSHTATRRLCVSCH